MNKEYSYMNFISINSPITICDIGASNCEPTKHIEDLIEANQTEYYGFEPNKEEFEKLVNSNNKKYFNTAIADGSKKMLTTYNFPGWSSFLKPDKNYIKNFFIDIDRQLQIISEQEFLTQKLDEIKFKSSLDLIKIDVQGLESIIIENGKKTIKNALVIELELSPIPIYKEEKKFSYVCNQLENIGFNLNMFKEINTKTFKPMIIGGNPNNGLNTIFQLDCVFVPELEKIKNLENEKLKKLIKIMFYSYKSYDFVDYLIQLLDDKQKTNLINEYRKLKLKIEKKY